jgi:uncharacterized protein (TIGR02270 family)
MEDAADIVDFVVREHVGMAAFLWAQHAALSAEDPPDRAALATVSARLEAHLDGIALAGAAAWPFIDAAYAAYPELGEVFVHATHALQTGDADRLEQAATLAQQAENGWRGLAGALARWDTQRLAPVVRAWLGHPDPTRCAAAVATLAAHAADPGPRLAGLLQHPDALVRAQACHLAAATSRQDAVPQLRLALTDADSIVQDAAALALARLGQRDGDARLMSDVAAQAEGWHARLRALVKGLPPADLRRWLSGLYDDPATRAVAIRAIGMTGDRTRLNWIVAQMDAAETIEAAGQAIVDLFPDAATDETLWSTEARNFPPSFAAHFSEDFPRLPLAAQMTRAFGPQAAKGL